MAAQTLIDAANIVLGFREQDGFNFNEFSAETLYQTDKKYIPETGEIAAAFNQNTRDFAAKAANGVAPTESEAIGLITEFMRTFGYMATAFVNRQTAGLNAGDHRIMPLAAWMSSSHYAIYEDVVAFVGANTKDRRFGDAIKAQNTFATAVEKEAQNTVRAAELAKANAAEAKKRAAASAVEAEKKRLVREAQLAKEEAERAAEEARKRAKSSKPVTEAISVATGKKASRSSSFGTGAKIAVGLAVVGVVAFLFLRNRNR